MWRDRVQTLRIDNCNLEELLVHCTVRVLVILYETLDSFKTHYSVYSRLHGILRSRIISAFTFTNERACLGSLEKNIS